MTNELQKECLKSLESLCAFGYKFSVSPETPPNRHPLTLHTSIVVKVDRDY